MQSTLKHSITFSGVGLHSGRNVVMTIHPASVNHGIWFRRIDIADKANLLPARWDVVERSPLCTRLVNEAGVSVSTIEHVMAALAGCGVHNAMIDIDADEVPILDGSAAQFVLAILDAGLVEQSSPVKAIKVLRPVEFITDSGWARLEPANEMNIEFHIDFSDPAIGVQNKALKLSNGAFVRELCDSRTFCRMADVEMMRANGLALGGTFDNAVVVDGAKVLSPGGLRHRDEAVRHKMLDALGDLSLAGAPLIARYIGHRAGHAITNGLLHTLFNTVGAYRMIECSPEVSAMLPGQGVSLAEMPAVA